MSSSTTPTVLTIAGSDPYGGAGVQVDAKVIHALGGYAFSITTASTAQNSIGVKKVFYTPIENFRLQLHTILDDIKVDAVKIGMLGNAENIMVIAEAIKKYTLQNIVLDTVLVSSNGQDLLEPDAIKVMVKELFPLVDVITPNIPEINTLLGTRYLGKENEIKVMAKELLLLGARSVLIKGGHGNNKEYAIDYLVKKGERTIVLSRLKIETTHTHGTGCVLSSGIATFLAKGESLEKSVQLAKGFLYEKLQTASRIKFLYTDEMCERKEPLL